MRKEKFTLSPESQITIFKTFIKEKYWPGINVLVQEQSVDLIGKDKLGEIGIAEALQSQSSEAKKMKTLIERVMSKQIGTHSLKIKKGIAAFYEDNISKNMSLTQFDPLFKIAIKEGNFEFFNYIFKNNIQAVLKNKENPMHSLAWAADKKTLEGMIKKFPHIKELLTKPDRFGCNPIHLGILLGNTSFVEYALTTQKDVLPLSYKSIEDKYIHTLKQKNKNWYDLGFGQNSIIKEPIHKGFDISLIPLLCLEASQTSERPPINPDKALKMTALILDKVGYQNNPDANPLGYISLIKSKKDTDIQKKFLNVFIQNGLLLKPLENGLCPLKTIYGKNNEFVIKVLQAGYDATLPDKTGMSFEKWLEKNHKKDKDPMVASMIENLNFKKEFSNNPKRGKVKTL